MGENVGYLEVQYKVVSDAAMRKLEKLQKAMDNVEEAATKQGKSIEDTFKKAGKVMAAFGAVATGVLYGLIRASAYYSMWNDQISHQMTRLSTKITEMLGVDKAMEFFIESLKLINEEIDSWGTDTDISFWGNLLKKWNDLCLKGKLVIGVLLAILGLLSLISAGLAVIGFVSFITHLSKAIAVIKGWKIAVIAGAVGTKILAGAVKLLTGAITFFMSSTGLIILAVIALIAILVYLWLQTEYGQAHLEALGIAWDNFKKNLKELGFLKALGKLIEEIVTRIGPIFIVALRDALKAIADVGGKILEAVYKLGKDIVLKIIDGIDSIFPGYKNLIMSFYDEPLATWKRIVTLVYNKAKEMMNKIIDGIDAIFPGFRAAVTLLYDKAKDIFSDMVTMAYNKAKDVVNYIIDGIDEIFPGYRDKITSIYTKAKEIFDDTISSAYTTGKDIINKIVEGLEAKFPRFTAFIKAFISIWYTDTDEILDRATETGEGVTEEFNKAGESTKTALDGTSDYMCAEMTKAENCLSIHADNMIEKMAEIPTEIKIDVITYYSSVNSGGSTVEGGGTAKQEVVPDDFIGPLAPNQRYESDVDPYEGWDDYGHTGSSAADQGYGGDNTSSSGAYTGSGTGTYGSNGAGQPDYALGGHILRSGSVGVHQGEDIVHLKSLLAGIKDNNNSHGDIIINPVINISSNGVIGNTSETNRVADVISKRMGDELRRITTGI